MGTQWNDRVDDQRMSAHQFNETGRVDIQPALHCRLHDDCVPPVS